MDTCDYCGRTRPVNTLTDNLIASDECEVRCIDRVACKAYVTSQRYNRV